MYNFKEREIFIIMKNNGFTHHHTSGSHAIFKNNKGQHVSIGLCSGNGAIMHRLSKQYNLDLSLRR